MEVSDTEKNPYLCTMPKINDYSLKRQMLDDLMQAYKRVCAKGCWTQGEAYERMVMEPAPRYYVTSKHAFEVLSPMMRGDFSHVRQMVTHRKYMYLDLYDEVVRMVEQPTYIGKSLWFIMQFAVQRPAPRFYISPARAKILRCMIKKGAIDDTGRVVEALWPSYASNREKKREKQRKIAERKRQWMQEKMSDQTRS